MGRRRPTRREAKATKAAQVQLARVAAAAAAASQPHLGDSAAARRRAASPLSRQLRCVHVSLIVYACVSIAAHALTPVWLAFVTPYCLVVGSCALLLGAAGAPLRGWKSRAAAILADDWRLPFMIILVWVTLAQGHGMDIMALQTTDGDALAVATFARHAWVGAAGIQGLCSVVLEYNLTNMSKSSLRLATVLNTTNSPSTAPGSAPTTTSPSSMTHDGSSGGAGSGAGVGEPTASATAADVPLPSVPSHEIYGPRRPLLLIITDIAATVHGITWFFVTASTRTISLPFVLWIAVVALVGEALHSHSLERLPTLRYHGVMWTAAVTCLALYGWATDWNFPELPLLQRGGVVAAQFAPPVAAAVM